MNKKDAQVIIRRVKKVQGGGHHGGAWKVAYADFVTAMMAFFLVMWLVGATTNREKAAVSEYFKNPSAFMGHSMSPAAGPNGPGGASTSMIKLGGAMEIPRMTNQTLPSGIRANGENPKPTEQQQKAAEEAAARDLEKKKLESLMDEMKAAIEKSQALAPFKDQLLLDITPLGLRIQIVDKQNRPMFDIGSAALKPYTIEILHELAKYLNEVPNKISISGHTDVTPYVSRDGYSNWELSTDRANAARRELIAGGMQDGRVALVVGLASAALFDKQNPTNPINRRISIVVMNKDAERAELGEESQPLPGMPEASTAAAGESNPAAASSTSVPATATVQTHLQVPVAVPGSAATPAAAGALPPAAGPVPGGAQSPPEATTQAPSTPIRPIVPIPSLAKAAAERSAAAAAAEAAAAAAAASPAKVPAGAKTAPANRPAPRAAPAH